MDRSPSFMAAPTKNSVQIGPRQRQISSCARADVSIGRNPKKLPLMMSKRKLQLWITPKDVRLSYERIAVAKKP